MGGEEGKYFLRTSCLLRPLSAPQKAELGIDCLLCRGREIGGVRLGARLVDVYVDLDSPPSKPSSPIFFAGCTWGDSYSKNKLKYLSLLILISNNQSIHRSIVCDVKEGAEYSTVLLISEAE